MTAIDVTGVLILSYATIAVVWTLCERGTAVRLRALAALDDRPSAIPALRREVL